MDEPDAATAGQLLAHAGLHFKDQPPRAGAITDLYASAFQIPAPYCETLGSYQGLFTQPPTGLLWTEHRINQN
jgi:hypothetical protein